MRINVTHHGNGNRASSETGGSAGLLTVRKVARFLGCSIANVYGLIKAGELPVITIGKSRGYRFDHRDLEEFLRRRKQQKAAVPPKLPRPRLKHIQLP